MSPFGTLTYPGLSIPITQVKLGKGMICFVGEIRQPTRQIYNFGGPMRIEAPDGSTIISCLLGDSLYDNTCGQVTGCMYVEQTCMFTGVTWGGIPPIHKPIGFEDLDWPKYEPLFTQIEEEYGSGDD